MMANSDSRVKAPTRGAGRRGAGDPPRAPTRVNRRGGGANSARVE